MVRNLRHVHGSDICVLRGRCNEFVMAGIACVALSVSGATFHALLLVYRYKIMTGAGFGVTSLFPVAILW